GGRVAVTARQPAEPSADLAPGERRELGCPRGARPSRLLPHTGGRGPGGWRRGPLGGGGRAFLAGGRGRLPRVGDRACARAGGQSARGGRWRGGRLLRGPSAGISA